MRTGVVRHRLRLGLSTKQPTGPVRVEVAPVLLPCDASRDGVLEPTGCQILFLHYSSAIFEAFWADPFRLPLD